MSVESALRDLANAVASRRHSLIIVGDGSFEIERNLTTAPPLRIDDPPIARAVEALAAVALQRDRRLVVELIDETRIVGMAFEYVSPSRVRGAGASYFVSPPLGGRAIF